MKRIILSCVTILLCATPLCAQQEDDAYNESVVVKGSYRPVIEQVDKINFPPSITDTLGKMEHTFTYSISPNRIGSHYEPTRIRAARIKGEPTTRLYNNYIRLGFGNYWTPLADLYWSSTRDRLKTYGARVNHLSSWDKLPEYGPNHFGNTDVTLFGKYIVSDNLQLSTDLNYEHDHNLYYGGLPDSTLRQIGQPTREDMSPKDYRASYNIASWNIGLHNMELDPNRFGYGLDMHLSDLWTIYGNNELNLRAEGNMHYGFSIADRYRGVAYLRALWDAYSEHYTPATSLPEGSPTVADTSFRHILSINPYADFMLGHLQFHVGLTTAFDFFSTPGNMDFHLFPDVMVSTELMRDKLALSLSATGRLEANTINSIRIINPYIIANPDLAATEHYDFLGHARWTLSKKLEANAEVGFSMLESALSFANMAWAIGSRRYDFNVLYIDYNQLSAGANVAFVNDEMITMRAGGHYYLYFYPAATSMGTLLPPPPYCPRWDAYMRADVNYLDRWLFHLEGRLLSKMQSYNSGNLPMRYGIAAEVEYRHNRALSFFLRMDNLAFQRYMLWDYYPSQRGLFILGLTYTL